MFGCLLVKEVCDSHVSVYIFVCLKERRNFCCAAIQLGDRYCAVTFSKEDDPASVKLIKLGKRTTTTTRLFLTDGGKIKLYGFDARNRYIHGKGSEEAKFSYFDELDIQEKVKL
jgi:hypothetical protein